MVSDGRYTKIRLQGDETYRSCELGIHKWKEIYAESGLLQSHRSYLINPFFVVHLGSKRTDDVGELRLIDEIKVPLSVKYKDEVETVLKKTFGNGIYKNRQ